MQRIDSIDYLRGLMALSVLLYHFASWSIGVPDASTTLGRLGIYAVSIFFIISGASLFIAYKDYNWNKKSLTIFIKKRYLRLVPAFWAGCFMMIALFLLTIENYSVHWKNLFYNLSLIFGFVKPGSYITAGGWSIGNEMVFYLIFPLVMWYSARRKTSMITAIFLSLIAFAYYAFYKLHPEDTLGAQWSKYIEPLNNVFLFFSGVLIGWLSERLTLSKNQNILTAILIASATIFILYPVSGNQINIVTGMERVIFTLICIGFCFATFNMKFSLDKFSAAALKTLGDISYTIYMFHGAIAELTLQLLAPALNISTPESKLCLLILFTLPTTLISSYFFFKLVEKPVMAYGRTRPETQAIQ